MAGRLRRADSVPVDPVPSEAAGDIITTLRTRAGHTRATLAMATGLNEHTVKIYEKGMIKNPTVDVFNKLHDGLLPHGFIGWEVLEAYGFETDAGLPGTLPPLVHVLRLLDDEAQDMVLQYARRELRHRQS